jgi:inositol transport system ATP-binding protein
MNSVMVDSRPLLQIREITKRFPGVAALDGVSLAVARGEIHGLLGENGAGKSTLLKIISGAQAPDAGAIEWDGREISIPTPQAAQNAGIVTIYQELNLIPQLSVAENIFIGREPLRLGRFIDWTRMRSDARAITRQVGLDIDPDIPVAVLSVAEQQMVEIARALSIKARLIIMDEPTSALSEAEVERLLGIMRALRNEGVSIMFVTHRLEEAMTVCDRITILRDGKLAATRDRKDLTTGTVIELMVGRAASELYRRPATRHAGGAIRLSVRGLCTKAARAQAIKVRDVDLDVRAGEILGIAGLVGAGRTELARAIFGADPLAAGTIEIDGIPVSIRSPSDAIRLGIGLVPEDRKQQALFLQQAIKNNFSIASLGQFLRAGIFVDERREQAALDQFRGSMNIRMRGSDQPISNLSGGNQQKVVLARWLAVKPKVLLVDEPTRGIDVAAKAEVHELLDRLAASGIAIVVISSELPEILAISDRIVTMCEGRITGEVRADAATQERLMTLMTLDQPLAQREQAVAGSRAHIDGEQDGSGL